MKAGIKGTGSYVPPKVITNEDISKIMDTSDEWIRTRTGITERRVTDEGTATSDLALVAAKKSLEAANFDAKDLDLILVATCTPDMLFPSTACILQDKLGANKAVAFDLSAACSGFNYALSVAASFIEASVYKTILVVGADTLTKYLDWNDRTTSVLFGDGAGAALLSPRDDGSGILSNFLYVEGSGGKYLTMPGGGSRDPEIKNGRFIKMNGKEVFKFAVRALKTSVREALKSADLNIEDVDLLIPHQANIRIVDHAIKRLNLPKEKVYVNLQKYGNTSAASVPIALDEAVKEGVIKKGNIVALSGFGAGLTSGANIIKW